MPIYSKSGKHYSHDYKYQEIKTLDDVDYDNEVIFYHHPYDKLQSGISLYDALDEKNWEYLRNNPTVKLMHHNDSETFEIYFVKDIVKTIKERNINPAQLHVVVMDENHKEFLDQHLGNIGINISVDNYLLREVSVPSLDYKFSALSRNYRIWRLYIYTELERRNLLKHFNYSFHNIHPYNNPPIKFPVKQMMEDLGKLGITDIPDNVLAWLNACPHELGTSNLVVNKWSNVTYDTIKSADFHLIIETHFDQKEFVSDNKQFDRNFAPTSITEKGYKSIACGTPFIAFSTPFYLEDLKKLGFKTYSPYINEAYDSETDSTKRLNMIVDEINRICSLDKVSYSTLVDNCKMIALENLQTLKQKKNAQ